MMYQILSNGIFLDVPDGFQVPITKEIADLRNPENKASDWSKTFTLPGTAVNRDYFDHIYHINYDNDGAVFDPNHRATAEIWVDSLPQLKGFLRLIQINTIDDDLIEFECSMHGISAELFGVIDGRRMSDLDFSEYDHVLSLGNVTDSWDNNIVVNGLSVASSNGTGYVYGLYNNGTRSSYSLLSLDDCIPYLYAKTVIDKIISNAGFSYSTASFFNDDFFKRLIVSSNDGKPQSNPTTFRAYRTTSVAIVAGSPVNFDAEVDPSGVYDLATDLITTTTVAIGRTVLDLRGEINFTGLTAGNNYAVEFTLKINGTTVETQYAFLTANGSGNITQDVYISFNSVYIGLNYSVEVEYTNLRNLTLTPFALGSVAAPATSTVSAAFELSANLTGGISPGNDVLFDNYFSSELKQSDFLKSFINLFNLFIDIDHDNPNKLVILPYEEYFVGTARDWTNKLDKGQELEILPMGELNAGRYEFSYQKAEDSYNKGYFDTYNRNYGDSISLVDNDFVKDVKRIEIALQPSQVATIGDKTYPLIDKFGGIRLAYWGGKKTCNQWALADQYPVFGIPFSYSTLTTYPLTLHVDDPVAPTLDLLYGIPFTTGLPASVVYSDNNSYNAFWSRYINEITDINSKIVTGYFNITPADFERLSFRDTYFFENSYFRLNKVIDYVPDRLTKCEFLQLQSYPTFAASSGDVGGEVLGELGGRVLKIGESQFQGWYRSVHVGANISESAATFGNFGAVSSGVHFLGNNNAAIACSGMIISENDALYLFNKKFNLYDPIDGQTVVYDQVTDTWIPGTPSSGAATFLDLTDTDPTTYLGQTGKFVKVNAGETGLEFATLTGGGDMVGANNLSDVANAATARTNLGLAIGTNVQAWNANLDSLATEWAKPGLMTPAALQFHEGTSNGTNKITVAGVANLASDYSITLPAETGTLVTNVGGVTFTNDISVPAEAYDATAWNGSNEVPTKNDIRDKIETIVSFTNELAQDAIGNMVDSSLTYVDGTPLLQRAALTGAITASAGSNTTALGSFTKGQLNTALSDGDIELIPYTQTSFTVPTENGRLQIKRLTLASTDRATIEGTARLQII
jgi:hypothetical protein